MLRKLLKHEFRATARIMVPVYLVLLVTALGANFSTRGILETPYAVLNILGSLLVLAFAGCIAFCLQFYAALAIGHSFSNHKFAWSVAFFFILQFASQLVGGLLLASLDTPFISQLLGSLDFRASGMTAVHIGMGILIAVCVVYSAVFYVITTYFLKKHLNLE